jgi:macrocin-O-methyltransferase TylF-like protien
LGKAGCRIPDVLSVRPRVLVQEALTRVGRHASPVAVFALDRVVDYLDSGLWMREHGYDPGRRVWSRNRLFDLAAAEAGHERVLYLEFGVGWGVSLRYWSRILTNPAAMLHGFDSFEGLPEHWNVRHPTGKFSTEVPEFDDPRVRLHVGWFADTLPEFDWPDHDRLIVNVDADLYSSTMTVLEHVGPRLLPGSFLYFDEFMDRRHERLAFTEFVDRTGQEFRLRGASRHLAKDLFERV